MNQSEINSAALAVPDASFSDLQAARRLIVLVPEFDIDTALAARKIWELANALECGIQFLGLSKDVAHEPGIRRKLIALSSMVGYEKISVETKIEIGSDWLSAARSAWHVGDVLVCFAGQSFGLAHKPLTQVLESSLRATVYVISDLFVEEERVFGRWEDAMAWAGSIVIILVFFWLQARLVQFSREWVFTALLYVSLFAEAGSIYGWNTLFE